jgi:hypothetical protein
MEARATLRGGRISSGVVMTFIVALLAAFLLGGAGGYLVRAVTIPVSTTTTTSVTETVPQRTLLPNASATETMPQQTILPNRT